MFSRVKEKAQELGAVFDTNKEIVQEFLSLLGEDRTWTWWQKKFPGMLPGDEPVSEYHTSGPLDWWIDSYHLTGTLERTERDASLWQLVSVGAEEG